MGTIQAPCSVCGLFGCRKGYSFSVRQGGMTVASGSASKADDAIRECHRYVFAYLAEGTVKYTIHHGRRIVSRGSLTAAQTVVGPSQLTRDV